jgi:1,2-diacylglycerol-3-alpha-glucose alpha-1,2-galactosyltransferase
MSAAWAGGSVAGALARAGAFGAELEALIRDNARILDRIQASIAGPPADINHYHTVDPHFFLHNRIVGKRAVSVCYVHFLPETVDDSLQIPPVFRQIFYKYLIAFYRSMDYLVVVNPVFAEKLAGYGIDAERIKYIPNYVACEGFSPMPRGEAAARREALGIGGGRFTVLGVGQLQRRKGVADFIAVAKALPGAQFLWAGGFSFGKISSGYDEIRAMLGSLPENVRFLGMVEREDMNAVYNASDLLFLPSYSELFPMSILEAACCEKPLLLRDIDAYPPILFDGYLKGGSVGDFAEIIGRLAGDRQEYAYWQGKSRHLRAFYDREHILRMWDEFYTQILERAGAGGRLTA